MRRAVCIAFVLWLAVETPALAVGVEAGFVEDYQGDPADYRLEREGSRVPIAVLTPIHTGDRVFVEHPEGRIRLRLGEARAVTLTKRDGPFFVAEASESATVLGNLARWAISWTPGEQPASSAVSLVARSAALKLPLCPEGVVQLLPKDRAVLHVAWTGGTAPYTIRLTRDEAPIGEASEVSAQRTSLALPTPTSAGRLRLEIVDSMDRVAAAPLELIERRVTQASPLRQSGEGSWLAHLVRAFDALGASGDAGRLAAYQEVSDVAEEYAPAAAVQRALEGGRVPSDPPPWH